MPNYSFFSPVALEQPLHCLTLDLNSGGPWYWSFCGHVLP